MKKPQIKLDKRTIQQFFLDHTEKVVFGMIALVLLVFIYQAMSLVGYKKEPKDLQNAVDSAKNHIEAGPDRTSSPEVLCPIDDYVDEIKKVNAIDLNKYLITPFQSEFISKRLLRAMPKAFPLVGLRVEAGRGAMAGESGGTHGQRWVLLTGVVPLKQQAAEFKTALDGTDGFDPQRDANPNYQGFIVERAEVGPAAVAGQTKIFTSESMEAAIKNLKSTLPEVVEGKFTDPKMTSLLPPIDRGWGKEVAHDPEIPLAPPERKPDGAGPGIKPGGGEGGLPGKPGSAKPGGNTGEPATSEVRTENLLFRFFDFDVDPGKQYKYRVFLKVANPNYGLDSKLLKDAAFARPVYLGQGEETKDAEGNISAIKINEAQGAVDAPSARIGVPEDTLLLASEVKPPLQANREIMGKLNVVKWMEDTGLLAYKDFAVVCGTETTCSEQGKVVGRRETVSLEVRVRGVVVDMDGGETLAPGERPRPGQILLLDKSGKMMIHDELDDKRIYDELTREPETPAEPAIPPDKPPGPKPKPRPGGKDDTFEAPVNDMVPGGHRTTPAPKRVLPKG